MEKAIEYLKLLKSGYTYENIGSKYSLTKMAVCLTLHKYLPEETKQIIKERGWLIGKRKKAVFTTIKCKYCGTVKESNYKHYTPKFCSKKCHSNFVKKALK